MYQNEKEIYNGKSNNLLINIKIIKNRENTK